MADNTTKEGHNRYLEMFEIDRLKTVTNHRFRVYAKDQNQINQFRMIFPFSNYYSSANE